MEKLTPILVVFLFVSCFLLGQEMDRHEARRQAQQEQLLRSKHILDDETYIPYVDSFVPKKTLKVRLVFIHYSKEDPRNFDANNPVHTAYFDKIFTRVNEQYSKLEDKNDCGDFIPNAQIRFEIIDRINIVSPENWDNSIWGDNAVRSASKGVSVLYEWLFEQGVPRDAINCVFTEAACMYDQFMNNGPGCDDSKKYPLTAGISASSPFPNFNLESGSANHYRNKFTHWYKHNNGGFCERSPNDCCPACPESWQTDPTNYVHELGHSVWGPHINNKCNHIMTNYIKGTYFSKYELGKIHRAFSVMNTGNIVLGCPKGDKPLVIDYTETWKRDYRSFNDILIKKGGHLTITKTLKMPNDSKILIEQGGKLTIEDGKITNACDKNWDGIHIVPEKSFLFFKTTRNQLEIMGESEIENNNYAVKKIKKGELIIGS